VSALKEKTELELRIIEVEVLLAQLFDLARGLPGRHFRINAKYTYLTGEVCMGINMYDHISGNVIVKLNGLPSFNEGLWEFKGTLDDEALAVNRWLVDLLSDNDVSSNFHGVYDIKKQVGSLCFEA
jgi:hypothetical protein